MTKYHDILRLANLGFSQQNIAYSCNVSKKTVNKVLKQAKAISLQWELVSQYSDAELEKLLFPKNEISSGTTRRMPDFDYIQKELLRNGVSKKLLWTEYLEECRQSGDEPLMYSQFCYYIQKDEEKRRVTMHIPRKPAEQIEVDWAGDPAHLINPETGELVPVPVFVGVMSYSQYAYAEAFPDEKQQSWISAHVHMYQYFGGSTRILVPDNCKTAVIHHGKWEDPRINEVYHDLAEYYGTAILPARVRKPKDKPNAEGSVHNLSTWIIAALRNEQFFTLKELNAAIRLKLDEYNHRSFQKKEGSRAELFLTEELPFMTKLPAAPYELAEWKYATVQFNYHISCDGMLYSVPYTFIKKKVDVRVTGQTIEVFYAQQRIASHRRLYGRKGQYSTVTEHMPPEHQQYLEWNGDRFRKWAKQIGESTFRVVDAILSSGRIEQQSYRSCMALLRMPERYSAERLEAACAKALTYTDSPSYKSIKNILAAGTDNAEPAVPEATHNQHGITRGADYYRR